MTRLIEQVKPDQFLAYGALKVGFYDAKNPDYKAEIHDPKSPNFISAVRVPEYLLYIHILLGNDDRSQVQRKAGNVRVPDGQRGTKSVPETEAYARAYKVYLDLKEASVQENPELEKLRKENAELRATKSKKVENVANSEEVVAKKLSEK